MIVMTLAEIAAAVEGTLSPSSDPAATVTGSVEFDSRAVTPGGLFLALAGERVDGHDFAAGAVAAGATGVLATRDTGVPGVLVADVLVALGRLARHVLSRLPQVRVIGVTGSSGKTTTKDMLASVLGELGPTVAPAGSFNNELGHPYTVLRADASTRFLVLENSARNVGHIAWLCSIARPNVAVVLNVGSAHLGEFGSREVIAQAKGELLEALRPGELAVLNADDHYVAAMADRTAARVVRVGLGEEAGVRAVDVTLDDGGHPGFVLRLPSGSVPVTLPGVGLHLVGNALAVAAVAADCGMGPEQIAGALGRAAPASRWRMEVAERADGVTIVNDAYNANPESMRAGLDALAAMTRAAGRRSVAVLGAMGELGPTSDDEHRATGVDVVSRGIGILLGVGHGAEQIVAGAHAAGMSRGDAVLVPDIHAARRWLAERSEPGDVVLVKASRAAGLDRLATALLESGSGA